MIEWLLDIQQVSILSFNIQVPSISIYLLFMIVVLIVLEIYRYYVIGLSPTIEIIERNQDGTLSITWGYVNYTYKDIFLVENESSLVVHSGAALMIGTNPPHKFLKGRHKRAFKTIVTEQSHVEWIIQNRRKKFVSQTKGRDYSEKRQHA